jgi:alkanesulfonate monooxygenase SsuD/methylene tetrahydromethanopterin reductase-like flavin-dependent oxidoreductase (luciferase family)
MVIAQKPWETTVAELAGYRKRFKELNGFEAPKPLLALVVGVSRDPAQAEKLRTVNLQNWAHATAAHYEFGNAEFAKIEGYEYYGALAATIAKHGMEKFNSFFADLQVWGTPDQVIEKLIKYVDLCDAGSLVTTLSFGGMSPQEARECFDVFSTDVLPALKAHNVGGDIGVPYGVAVR